MTTTTVQRIAVTLTLNEREAHLVEDALAGEMAGRMRDLADDFDTYGPSGADPLDRANLVLELAVVAEVARRLAQATRQPVAKSSEPASAPRAEA